METPTDIETLGIGEKDAVTLKPKMVKIISHRIEPVGAKNSLKLICTVKHPDRQETIDISSVKYESKGALKVSGLWINLDDDKKIRKGSALAVLLTFLGCSSMSAMDNKEIMTVEDEGGYLAFKSY